MAFNIEETLKLALQHYRAGQGSYAELRYRQVLQADPRHSDAWHMLGMLAYQAGEQQAAIQFIQHAIRINMLNPHFHGSLGLVYQSQGRLDQAEACYQQAIVIRPSVEAYANLGKVYIGQRHRGKAIDCYQRALLLKPDAIQVYLNLGNAHLEQAHLEEAADCYQRALAINPQYSNAYNNLGQVFHKQHKLNEALACYQRARILKPFFVEVHMNMGNIYMDQGALEQAVTCYRQAVALKYDFYEAHYNLGNAFYLHNKRDEAVILSYDRAIALKPDFAEAYHNRGIALSGLTRYEMAILSYDRAIALKPDFVEAYHNRGIALSGLTRYEMAILSYDRAIVLKPDMAEAYDNHGNALKGLERYEAAILSYDRAITLKFDFAETYNNRGIALNKLRRHEAAILSYDRAIALKPDMSEAHNNRGNALKELGQYEAAILSYDQAIALKPDFAEVYHNRGFMLSGLTRYEMAIPSYDRAIALKFDHAYGNRLHAQMSIALWDGLEEHVENMTQLLAQDVPISNSFCLFAVSVGIKTLQKCAMLFMATKYPPARDALWKGERYRHNRIRLAYFSADFHRHATAYLIAELLEKHDRHRFEVFAFSFGPDSQDDMRMRLVKAVDCFLDVSKQNDQAIAALVRQKEIDIAVDLKGYTQNCRPGIFAQRPAPIQVNYLGFPGTMGAPYIDYIIADPIVIPETHFEAYSEKVVHLPHSYQANDTQRYIAEVVSTRSTWGLPEKGMVFCCFNNHFKITPDVFSIWMRLLAQIDGSVLWLTESNTDARRRLRQEAQNRGIAPERLIFAPRMNLPEHLARHQAADLFLDTFYCNAHTTTSDALWAGLPVLTCLGNTFSGRVAASLLHAIGLPELITYSPAEYETLALHLATHPDDLAFLKLKLARQRMTHPLFNSELFTKHIEAAYLQMWQRYQQGQLPAYICITP